MLMSTDRVQDVSSNTCLPLLQDTFCIAMPIRLTEAVTLEAHSCKTENCFEVAHSHLLEMVLQSAHCAGEQRTVT